MQGPSPLIVTSVELIVVEICLKIRQPSVFSFFFFCYHCSKMDFIIIVLRCKENCVRMVLVGEITLIFSTENY